MDVTRLTRNAVDVLPAGGLEEKLKLGRPLRVKLGIDVTSPDIHVGRAIPLQRMRAFQDEGHTGVLIVGDYTTRIGDPSGRSAERPILSDEEIDANAKTYLEQAMIILDPERTEVRYNGEWLAKLSYADIVRLARTITVARILERDDFSKRMKAQEPISISELLYPLMQAYDSVAIEADVELGGTDQLYNLLAGREVMPHYGLEPQVVLTTPLLLSWDGAKMSSSVGNNIPLTAAPEEMFGRTMRISDDQLAAVVRADRGAAVPPTATRSRRSSALARLIVARSHGEEAARTAGGAFLPGRAARRGPRRRARARARRRRSRAPAEADRRRRPRRLDERGAPADRAGRGEAERRAVVRARPAARGARGRAAAGRQAPVRPVDTLGAGAILLRPSERAA